MQVRVNEARQDDFVLKGRVDFVRKSLKPWAQAFKRADFENGAVPHRDRLSNRLAGLHCVDFARRVYNKVAHNFLAKTCPDVVPVLSCCFMVAKRGSLSAFN